MVFCYLCAVSCGVHQEYRLKFSFSSWCIKAGREPPSVRQSHCKPTAQAQLHTPLYLTHIQPMDLFAFLASVASDIPESAPTSSTPIDADGGGGNGSGCVVA